MAFLVFAVVNCAANVFVQCDQCIILLHRADLGPTNQSTYPLESVQVVEKWLCVCVLATDDAVFKEEQAVANKAPGVCRLHALCKA